MISLQQSIETDYVNSGRYDVSLYLPSGFAVEDSDANPGLVVTAAKGLTDNLVPSDGGLQTPELSITVLVTKYQDRLLQLLYSKTVHALYIDERWPITVAWGDLSVATVLAGTKSGWGFDMPENEYGQKQYQYYLADYAMPSDADFARADMMKATLSLRQI